MMPQSQLIQFPFRSGIDEKTDPKNAQPGTLTSLVNMRQKKSGKLERRHGHTTITTSVASLATPMLTGCLRLGSVRTELVLLDGQYLYAYSPQSSVWMKRDRVPRLSARHEVVQQFDGNWTDAKYATANGVEVFVWLVATSTPNIGQLYATVRDVASGTVLVSRTAVGGTTSTIPVLLVTGSAIVLMWLDFNGVTNIVAQVLDATNPTAGWSSSTILQTTACTYNHELDAVETTAGAFVYIFAIDNGGGTAAIGRQSCTVVASTGVITPVNGAGLVDIGMTGNVSAPCLAYDAVNAIVYLTYSRHNVTPNYFNRIVSFNPSTCATIAGPVSLYSEPSAQAHSSGCVVAPNAVTPSAPTIHVIYESVTASSLILGEYFSVTPALSGVQWGSTPNIQMWSKPYLANGLVYCVFWYAQTFFVCQMVSLNNGTPLVAPRPVGTLLPRQAYSTVDNVAFANGVSFAGGPLSRVYQVGTTPHFRFVGSQISDAELISRGGMVVHHLIQGEDWINNSSSYPAQPPQLVEFGELLHMSGGVPSSYDGVRVVEESFLYPPTGLTLTPSAIGGHIVAGTYLYAFTYEWTDARGQVYRSAPSVPQKVVVPGTTVGSVGVTVSCLNLTTKQQAEVPGSAVQVIAYRTTVNGDGSVFYRQTAYQVPSTNLNNPIFTAVSWTDTNVDTDISTGGAVSLLYTNGGTLANQPPPALSCLIKHRRRVCGIGDDGRTVWFSSEFVDREALKWNDELQIEFDEPLSALASMDDRLLAFSKDNVWFITGDGPNDLGNGSDWSAPTRVQCDTGCIDPRSVMTYADGVIFRSYAGFYMIDRGLSVSFIGSLVEDTTAANPLDVCSLSQVHSETSCFVSCIPTASSVTGVRLHWDTFRKMWAKDLLTDGSQASAQVAGLATWLGTVVCAGIGGQVYQQVSTQWTDGTGWYDSSFITAFISAGGPAGFQRARVVQIDGDWQSNHDVKLSFGFDYDDNFVQSYQWTADALDVRSEGYVRLRVGSQNGANPRCEGIRIKCEVLTPTNPSSFPIGTGQAATFSGVGLEIVPKTGQRRLGAGVIA